MEKDKKSVASQPNNSQNSQKRISVAELMRQSKDRIQKEEEEKKKKELSDQAKNENYYLKMQCGNTTTINVIPLLFTSIMDNSVCSTRSFNHGTSVIFETLEKNEQGTGNVKKFFNVLPTSAFRDFENMFNVRVLTDEDEELVEEVNKRVRRLFKYYPFFDRTSKGQKVDLPDKFVTTYRHRLRLNYLPDYMVMPVILLSEEYIDDKGAEINSVHNKFAVLHFAKKALISDWNVKFLELLEKDPEAAESCMNGPVNGNCEYYLSIKIDKIKADKSETNTAKPDRIVELKLEDFNPKFFKKSGNPIQITEEITGKVYDLYDKPGWFRTAFFESENYRELLNILITAENWLAECNISLNGTSSVADQDQQGNLLNSVEENHSSNKENNSYDSQDFPVENSTDVKDVETSNEVDENSDESDDSIKEDELPF